MPLSHVQHGAGVRPLPHQGTGGRRDRLSGLVLMVSASNDNSNLMEAVRHALMINRLTYDAASITHFDVFRWATEGSARCLGRDDIGKIAGG